jgi:hypothetical protein
LHYPYLTANRTIRIPDTSTVEPSFQAITAPEPPIAQARDTSQKSQAPPDNIETQASVDWAVAEDWATPATQREPTLQQLIINVQTLAAEQSSPYGQAADGIIDIETIQMISANAVSPQLSLHLFDILEREFNIDDADA